MSNISVVVPTYNCANYIAEALTSVLHQTLSPCEILVIDDGSTDNTAEVVAAFNDSRIRYLKQENAGVSAARNYGLECASGNFIAFLDADDRWLPTMLERQYATLSKDPELVFCFTNFIRFDDPSSNYQFYPQFDFYPELLNLPCEPTEDDAVKIIRGDAFCQLIAFGEVPGYTQAIMFNAGKIKDLRFDTGLKVCEDAEYVLRCSAFGRVAYDKTLLVEVRRHNNNVTRDTSLIAMDKLKIFLKLLEFNYLTDIRRNALLNRLAKAYWDAANAQLLVGRRACSWRCFKNAWRQNNGFFSNIKRSIRWFINYVNAYR